MANQLQDSILKAFDTIAANRVNSLQLDKTVEAIVSQCVNTLTGEYKVEYQGGFISAYAQEGKTYNRNAKVYVLIPENDMTKKKIILGLATQGDDDDNITFVSSMLNDYTPIGKNILSIRDNNDVGVYGVNSYRVYDSITLYNVNNPKGSILKIDTVELENNIKDAQALMFEASFLTRLPKEHQSNPKGRYVLDLVAAFKHQNELPQDYYTANLPQIPHNSPYFIEQQQDVMQTLKDIWEDIGTGIAAKQKDTKALREVVNTYLTTNRTILSNEKEACERFYRETESLVNLATDDEIKNLNYNALQEKVKEGQRILANIIEQASHESQTILKHYSYPLDSFRMLGDPYRFKKYVEQYELFPIQEDTFSHIENITLYCENFVNETDEIVAEESGNTIFCKEIEFYCMRKIDGTNGEYSLRLSTPQGTTLKGIQSTEELSISASMVKQNLDLTGQTMFYWFKYDNRVKPESKNYSKYGGYNWALLDGGAEGTIIINGTQNRAHKNRHKCVAVYKNEIILVQEFYIYNTAGQYEISIVSNIGNKFSFDTGVPTFTCLIDRREENFTQNAQKPDELFGFRWSVTDDAGVTTVFDKTIDQLKEEANEKEEAGELTPSQLLSLKKILEQLSNIEFKPYENKIVYSAAEINQRAVISCSVYYRDNIEQSFDTAYSIGDASLIIENEETAVEQSEFYVVIDNANQVFQYDEAGIAPDSNRFDTPQEIKPLTAHFFDKSNREIIPERYDLKWRMPIINTLIATPNTPLVQDPVTEKLNLLPTDICNFSIKKNFDYTAFNNQIEAVVTYGGKQYVQSTNFSFLKIGDNGTNGTDVVARLRVKNEIKQLNPLLDDYRLAIEINKKGITNSIPVWNVVDNNGKNYPITASNIFQVDIFQREDQLPSDIQMDPIYGLAGGDKRSRYLTVTNKNDGALSWTEDGAPKDYRKQILKVETKVKIPNNIADKDNTIPDEQKTNRTEVQSYYSFYPIPVIKWTINNPQQYQIQIKKSGTVENILYDADGQNPQWNTLQGIELEFLGLSENKWIEYSAEGGYINTNKNNSGQIEYSDPPTNCAFKLKRTMDDEIGTFRIEPVNGADFITKVYLQPDDIYNGEYTNNVVHVQVYDVAGDDNHRGNLEAEIWIPIHMSLNTYSLASLNQWDGNHIDINEDEEYIMAPQIGAGIKDYKTNKFTGLVMGQVGTYGRENPKVGLQGYIEGQQSLFIDAYTGNTILGVGKNDNNNQPIEGQIKLIPYGDSSIGNWHIGKNDLFNIPGIASYDFSKEEIEGDNKYYKVTKYANGAYVVPQIDSSKLPVYKGYTMYDSEGNRKVVGELNSDYKIAIPHDLNGILLNAEPGRISVKGKTITAKDPDYQFNPSAEGQNFGSADEPYIIPSNRIATNSWLMPGDSYELELNPNDISVFTLFQHTQYYQENGRMKWDGQWKRLPRTGIDHKGRFYSNALKDNATALYVGDIDSFNEGAIFKGAGFEVGSDVEDTTPLIKFFTDNVNSTIKDTPVYISGTDSTNEYRRPISMHGKELSLYAGSSNQRPTSDKPHINRTTPHKIIISADESFIGHEEKNYLHFVNEVSNSTATSKLFLSTNFEFDNASNNYGNRTLSINTGATTLETNDKALTVETGTGNIFIEQIASSSNEISIRRSNGNGQIPNRILLGDGATQISTNSYYSSTKDTAVLKLVSNGTENSYLGVPDNLHFNVSNKFLIDNAALEINSKNSAYIKAYNNKTSFVLGANGGYYGFQLRGHNGANLQSNIGIDNGYEVPHIHISPHLQVGATTYTIKNNHALTVTGNAKIYNHDGSSGNLRTEGGIAVEGDLTVNGQGTINSVNVYRNGDLVLERQGDICIGRYDTDRPGAYGSDDGRLWVGTWIDKHIGNYIALENRVGNLEDSSGGIPSHHHNISLNGRAINVVNSAYIPTASLQFFNGPDRPTGAPNGIPPLVKVVGGQIYSNDVIATGGPIAD